MRSVLQGWVMSLTFMQQSVLMSAIRGCDGLQKHHKAKPLLKWYRRCILLSAFDGRALTDPFELGGGSFTGPIDMLPKFDAEGYCVGDQYYGPGDQSGIYDWKCSRMQWAQDNFMDSRDELHSHYQVHAMHAFEIVGYKHPDPSVREFWRTMYERMAHAYHLWPETEEQMDRRLGDSEIDWRARGDVSLSCSD